MMQYYISSSWVVSGSTWLTCHCVLECWTRWVSGIINQYSSSDVNKHGRIDLTGSEALFCLSIHVFWSAESNPVCIKWYFGGLILNPKMGNINSFLTNITMVLAVELFQQCWWNIVCKLLLNLSQSLLGQRWNTTKWIKSNIISCRYWHQGHWDGGWGSQYKVPESLQRYRLRPPSTGEGRMEGRVWAQPPTHYQRRAVWPVCLGQLDSQVSWESGAELLVCLSAPSLASWLAVLVLPRGWGGGGGDRTVNFSFLKWGVSMCVDVGEEEKRERV